MTSDGCMHAKLKQNVAPTYDTCVNQYLERRSSHALTSGHGNVLHISNELCDMTLCKVSKSETTNDMQYHANAARTINAPALCWATQMSLQMLMTVV